MEEPLRRRWGGGLVQIQSVLYFCSSIPGPPTQVSKWPHACCQNVLFVTKEKGRAVLTLHTGLLLKRGGCWKRARIQKKKVEPYWLYTPDFCWKGGVGWNTHMRTLNNTEWGGGRASITRIDLTHSAVSPLIAQPRPRPSAILGLSFLFFDWLCGT